MERKKVAVLLPWLKMGGTNKIAVNFMSELAQYCDVTLVLSKDCGELLPELPDGIEVIIDQMQDFPAMFNADLKGLHLSNLFHDLVYYAKIRGGKDSVDNYKYIVDRTPAISEREFDCAISYHGQSPERLLNLIYRINCKKRVAWIHGEINFDRDKLNRLRKYYAQVDHFFFVSNPTLESFDKAIGFDRAKGTVYYNPIDKQDILRKAEMPMDVNFDSEVCNLLTVGRLSAEKGQDMIPAIVRRLTDMEHRVCWYIVGDGDNRSTVERLIEQYDVKEQVRILGVKTNPYPYMKNCTIYVQPSYTEGYSTTICEAGMLGKAIVGTKPSGGIRDQITDGQDGLIVDATVEGLTNGIAMLIDSPQMREQFEAEILKKNFEGKGEIKKFLEYIGYEEKKSD